MKLLLAASLVLFAAIYGISAAQSNPQSLKERFSKGELTAFVFKKSRDDVPGFKFTDGDERPLTLADWKGKVVLLNLWATWCGPCRKEMPGLDRLQGELGSDDFEVVALSVDRKGIKPSAKFLKEVGAENLGLYVDDTAKAMFEMRARGLPATFLIDRDGRLIGRLVGPAEWDTEEAKTLIEAAIRGELEAVTN
jgi:thiol-disulfide isomerase/thioredoxin